MTGRTVSQRSFHSDHESPELPYPAGGRTKTMTLSEADVPVVREALERHRLAPEEHDGAAEAEIAFMRALPGTCSSRCWSG